MKRAIDEKINKTGYINIKNALNLVSCENDFSKQLPQVQTLKKKKMLLLLKKIDEKSKHDYMDLNKCDLFDK